MKASFSELSNINDDTNNKFIPWGICLHEPEMSVHQNFAKGKKYSPSCHQGSDVLLICMYIGLCLYGYVHTHIYSCFHIAQFFLNSSREHRMFKYFKKLRVIYKIKGRKQFLLCLSVIITDLESALIQRLFC